MIIHQAEENYLKAIYALTIEMDKGATTNLLAEYMSTKASSVTDMAKRLAEKELVNYTKYKGFTLTATGRTIALNTVRKHRLWEVFLVEKLNFKWDEVHEIAEQLEHIRSEQLTNRLDSFLNYPKFDPHGDPIPDKNGLIEKQTTKLLSEVDENIPVLIVGVKDSSTPFLQYLEAQQLLLGTKLTVVKRFEFDQSLSLLLNNTKHLSISQVVSKNLIVSSLE